MSTIVVLKTKHDKMLLCKPGPFVRTGELKVCFNFQMLCASCWCLEQLSALLPPAPDLLSPTGKVQGVSALGGGQCWPGVAGGSVAMEQRAAALVPVLHVWQLTTWLLSCRPLPPQGVGRWWGQDIVLTIVLELELQGAGASV